MKIKRQSAPKKNSGYLGHFAQQKYLDQGHNDSGTPNLKESYPAMEPENATESAIKGLDQDAKNYYLSKLDPAKFSEKMSQPEVQDAPSGGYNFTTTSRPGKVRSHRLNKK